MGIGLPWKVLGPPLVGSAARDGDVHLSLHRRTHFAGSLGDPRLVIVEVASWDVPVEQPGTNQFQGGPDPSQPRGGSPPCSTYRQRALGLSSPPCGDEGRKACPRGQWPVAIRGPGQLSVRGFLTRPGCRASAPRWLNPRRGGRWPIAGFLRHLMSHTNSRMSQAETLFISKPFSACGFRAKCGNLRESCFFPELSTPVQTVGRPCPLSFSKERRAAGVLSSAEGGAQGPEAAGIARSSENAVRAPEMT